MFGNDPKEKTETIENTVATVFFIAMTKTETISEWYTTTICSGLTYKLTRDDAETITAQKWKLGLLKFQHRVNSAHRASTRKFPVRRYQMTYSPYSDVIIKMQKELDSKDREIEILKSIIDGEAPESFKQQEVAIIKLERQLELKDTALKDAKLRSVGTSRIISDKDKSIADLQKANLELRELITDLKNTIRKERDERTLERSRAEKEHRKRRNKKSGFEKEFDATRPSILERDNYKCVECGSNKNLHVHHIVHRKNGGTNDPDNLVTLCKWCHAERHKDEPVYHIMTKGL